MSIPDKSQQSTLQEIESGLLTHVSKAEVPYKIVHGWDLKSSAECDRLWKEGWIALLDQIQQTEPDKTKQVEILNSISTEDFHWDWFSKAVNYNTDEYEWFHLYAENKPQAVCLIYHPKESALDPGDIFYVMFVAVSPWNRNCSLRPRQFSGLGALILKAAQRFAVAELGLRPGFCLHSLPEAEGFYTKLNMVKVDGKEDSQSLPYFELSETWATQFMEGY